MAATEVKERKGLFSTQKVVFQKTYGDIILREFEGIECEGAAVIPSFPSSTFTSIILAGYLLEQLSLPLIGSIAAPTLLPPKAVLENSLPSFSIRILGNKKLVIIQSESKIPEVMVKDVVDLLLDFSTRHKTKLLLFTEGLPAESTTDKEKDKVHFLSNDVEFVDQMEKFQCVAISEGIISGLLGGVLSQISVDERAVKIGCLLSPCSAHHIDASSSLSILLLLKKWILPDIETIKLEKQAFRLDEVGRKLDELTNPTAAPPYQMYN
eukprot:TRINITY_DN2350_c0_g1_i2.p1 TRINITY_DN2350_c0_g1~~TRINITY_DN2350_c0_g1_i2.p1  ORF type:complete len:302 (-),score=79.63 TRINITY_DN2350_c0_g1_i2:117-917(-)